MIKKCGQCGAAFDGNFNSLFCAECAEQRRIESIKKCRKRKQAEYKKRYRQQFKKPEKDKPKEVRKPKPKIKEFVSDNKQCKKCLYRLNVCNDNTYYCGYLFYTGKRRPSDPPPECAAFEPYDKKKRQTVGLMAGYYIPSTELD